MKDLMTMHLRHQQWLERHGKIPLPPKARIHGVKVTDEQIVWARTIPLQDDTVEFIMKALSISQTTTYNILAGRVRSDLDPPKHPKYVPAQRRKPGSHKDID